jgi:uncharacterized protein YkwD
MASSRGLLVALAAALALLLLPTAASAGQRSVLSARDSIEAPIAAKINRIRRAHGLRPLHVAVRLARAAAAHSTSMAQGGYFSHSSADGTLFWRRIARYYPRTSPGWTVGENLVWSSGDLTPARAVRMWMHSPPHRAVILGRAWRQIGIAAVRMTNAGGVYGGLDVTIVTADFGAR